jgi:hypothetical protein
MLVVAVVVNVIVSVRHAKVPLAKNAVAVVVEMIATEAADEADVMIAIVVDLPALNSVLKNAQTIAKVSRRLAKISQRLSVLFPLPRVVLKNRVWI